MRNRLFLGAVLLIQALCATFFVGGIVISVFGLTVAPLNWQLVELIEIGAALGLLLGIGVSWFALRQAEARTQRAEDALRLASGAFMEVIDERFTEWGLTPAERDVAMFSIKGLSMAEIAGLRETSEGTVKAQTAAIYRKAGVSGRPQFLSLFIDDLLAEE